MKCTSHEMNVISTPRYHAHVFFLWGCRVHLLSTLDYSTMCWIELQWHHIAVLIASLPVFGLNSALWLLNVKGCCFVQKPSSKSHTILNQPIWRRKKKNILTVCQLSGSVLSRCFFAIRHVVCQEILQDEWYVVIKACKFKGRFCIIIYCASARSLHIESTDSKIRNLPPKPGNTMWLHYRLPTASASIVLRS